MLRYGANPLIILINNGGCALVESRRQRRVQVAPGLLQLCLSALRPCPPGDPAHLLPLPRRYSIEVEIHDGPCEPRAGRRLHVSLAPHTDPCHTRAQPCSHGPGLP